MASIYNYMDGLQEISALHDIPRPIFPGKEEGEKNIETGNRTKRKGYKKVFFSYFVGGDCDLIVA